MPLEEALDELLADQSDLLAIYLRLRHESNLLRRLLRMTEVLVLVRTLLARNRGGLIEALRRERLNLLA